MLDVHVLTLPGLPAAWVDQRRASIAEAVAQAGFPVSVHEVEGIPGHLGQSRAKGYAKGSHPYVTHVDHDDYLLPEAFAVLRPHLEAGVDAITTGERLVFNDGSEHDAPEARHHLAVYRRGLLSALNYARFKHYPDQYILSRFDPVHIPECVYLHRIWTDSASRTQRREDRETATSELEVIQRRDLARLELMTSAEIAAEIDKELACEPA